MTFRVAISGLRAASTDLDTIGNNVANANTTGFKRSRAEFADVQAVSGIGGGGGANIPGGGVNLARVAQQFSPGNITFTDNAMDLAISGQGFFVLEDQGARVYSRAGAFGLDKNGFVVNAQGQNLIAFTADAAGNITGVSAPLQISTANIPPKQTGQLNLQLNLDSGATPPAAPFNPNDASSFNNSTTTTVFDSLGNALQATTYYRKLATPANTWETFLFVNGVQVDGPDQLQFSSTGALVSPAGGQITSPSFTPPTGGAPMTLTLDYSGSTQFGSQFAVHALSQDGFTTGRISGIDIDSQGVVFARFTNGQAQVQGQVALANFTNQQGLQPLGDNAWSETFASGAPLVGAPGSGSLGLVQAGALEESNVDLAEELVKMVIAQRNFQANAQVISTQDAVTQSIINIR